jgi:hypothetical protein
VKRGGSGLLPPVLSFRCFNFHMSRYGGPTYQLRLMCGVGYVNPS